MSRDLQTDRRDVNNVEQLVLRGNNKLLGRDLRQPKRNITRARDQFSRLRPGTARPQSANA